MREHKRLVAILLFALVVRVGFGLSRGSSIDPALPDQNEYLQLGRNLLFEHRLEFFDERFGQVVKAYRTPGYPVFVAMFGGDVRAIRVAQAIVDTLTVLGVYLLARTWLSRKKSLVAAGIAAINPFLIFFTSLILTETLFIALLIFSMLATARKRWIIGGVIMGVAVLVRPGAIGLPIVLGLVGCFANRVTVRPYHFRPLLVAAVLGGLTAIVLLPWALRNRLELGSWVWLSTNGGVTKFDGFNAAANGGSNQSFLQQMPQLREMNEVQRDEYLSEQANNWIARNPERTAALALTKLGRMWSPVPLSSDYGTRRNVIIGLIYSVPFDVMVIVGLLSRRLRGSAKFFLIVPAIYFSVVHALSVGSLRYRLPAEAALTVVAAVGVSYLMRKRKEVDVAER